MTNKSSPHSWWMPLDIGNYLQDTANLDIAESGAYLHLLMWYWVHGPLPDDAKQLAQIAKMTPDAWSIAFASLSMFFQKGEDGRLHQRGADRRRDVWIEKRQKAHEKAVKAARARWDKEKAKRRDAPSIAQAMPIIGISTNPLGDSLHSSPLPPTGISALLPGAPSMHGDEPPSITKGESRGESEEKAKTTETGAGTVDAWGGKGNHGAGIAAGRKGPRNRSAGHAVNGAGPPIDGAGLEERFSSYREEVFAYWSGQNPGGKECPWLKADRKALADLLKGKGAPSMREFKGWLRNRAQSAVNPADPPRKWLRDLTKFSSGRLDRYGHPMEEARKL